jgi:serine/threonine protein kinase
LKLVDLGLGLYLGKKVSNLHTPSLEEIKVFQPPEQVENPESGNPSADVYSLGAVLHRVASGQNQRASREQGSAVTAILENIKMRSGKSFADSLSRAEAEKFGKIVDGMLDSRPQNRPTASEVLAELHSITKNFALEDTTTTAAETSNEIVPASREVNAWLVDAELPLAVGRHYTLAIDIGQPRSGRVGGVLFSEPDWGNAEQLEIVILLEGAGFEVTPLFQRTMLPKSGNMEPVFFTITRKSKSTVTLNLSIFLARELSLLEEFTLDLSVKEQSTEMAEVAG